MQLKHRKLGSHWLRLSIVTRTWFWRNIAEVWFSNHYPTLSASLGAMVYLSVICVVLLIDKWLS